MHASGDDGSHQKTVTCGECAEAGTVQGSRLPGFMNPEYRSVILLCFAQAVRT